MATILDKLAEAVRKVADFNSASQVAPSCILWPDGDRQFESALPLLLKALPELLVLGSYDTANRAGPAIWLRCAIASRADEYDPQGRTPVIYLPGVSRSGLRAVEGLPEPLRPLAYLAFRGAVFQQRNGKDWTAMAFLVSKDAGGLGLDIAGDDATRSSLLSALPKILETDVGQLSSHHIESLELDTVVSGGDQVKNLLQWLDQGDAWRKKQGEDKWNAFVSICKKAYAFNPDTDGQGAVLCHFADRRGAWRTVFERYEESWTAYPQILPNLKLQNPPAFNLFATAEEYGGWPQWNEFEEGQLNGVFKTIPTLSQGEALKKLEEAEERHAPRRSLVWAMQKLSPMALALRHLLELARLSSKSLPLFTGVDDLADWYGADGWRTDAAARLAVAAAGHSSSGMDVMAAVRHFYKPWLEKTTLAFQELVAGRDYPPVTHPPKACADEWCIFTDGLRLDVARELRELLMAGGYEVAEERRWAPVPTITASGKPFAVPGGGGIEPPQNEGFLFDPLKGPGESFAKYLAAAGLADAAAREKGKPVWKPVGDIDTEGHEHGEKLSVHVGGELEVLVNAVGDAFASGAGKVRIVTDHGWLWLPGALPKHELETALADSKSPRHAAPKFGVKHGEIELGWSWNEEIRVAFAPGICAHRNGMAYAHGGLSLQECLLLDLSVTKTAGGGGAVAIKEKHWRGMRLSCRLEGDFKDCRIDVRKDPHVAESLLSKGPSGVDGEGNCKCFVADESLSGEVAFVVALDAEGNVRAQRKMIIGD